MTTSPDRKVFNQDLRYILNYYRTGIIRVWVQPGNNSFIKINRNKFQLKLWWYYHPFLKTNQKLGGLLSLTGRIYKQFDETINMINIVKFIMMNSTNYQL